LLLCVQIDGLEGPVVVGLEATGSMQWFLELLDELGIQYRVGHPAKIRAAEPRKQKHDRRDARLVLYLLERDHYMPAFKVSQFADNFLLPLVELEMVIRLFLRPFMMVSDSSWFSEWPHFLVDFA
jgi:hypothetical protein